MSRGRLALSSLALAAALASSGAASAGVPAAPGAVCGGYPFAAPPVRRVITLDSLRVLLRSVISTYWRNELGGYSVEIETFRSNADYLKSGVRPLTILRSALNRAYVVYVNERLLTDAPSDLALRAILVHETKHVVDYTQMSSVHFIGWVAQYVLLPQATYERATDLAPLRRGLGCGLMEYRVWLYRRVDAKTRALKERNYFTPPEIASWMSAARATSVAAPR